MKTIKLSMGQALVKFLDNQYVEMDGEENKFIKGIFTIFGHGIVVGLGQALEQGDHNLKVYKGNNEQGMALAAMGYAKQKNRKEIIACASSIGPGALNMITAAGCATVNRIPLLLLPGDSFACRQPDPVLQQVEQFNNFSVTANDAFKAVTRYWDRVVRPEQLMTAALHAMRVLTDPVDTGAVALCLPQDVQGEVYDYPVEFFQKRVHHIDRRLPCKSEVDRAAEIIMNKKKPLIICGGGVVYSEAQNELKKFSEKFNVPYAETQAGKSALPWNHEFNLGGIGVTGNSAANKIAKDADVVIGIGTRFSDFTTSSKWAFRNPDVEFIALNVNKFDAVKLNSEFLIADAKEGLKALTKELTKRGYKSAYTDEIKDVKKEWDEETDRLYSMDLEIGLSQTRILGEVNKGIDKDAIVVGASGSLPGDMQRVWRSTEFKSYHMEYGFSCMGYEIAASLGTKMAEPEKEVYSLVGDGSYLMLHTELVTSIQEGYKVNVILLDNNGFQCIRNLQDAQGIGMFATELRYRDEKTGLLTGEYVPIDFAKNAESYGLKTYTATTVEEFKVALESSKKDKVSTLIDVKVLPKTMTDGYESWWRVGVPGVANKESVLKAHEELILHEKELKKF